MASRIKKNQHTKPDIQVQDFLSSEQVKGELKDIPLIQVDLSPQNYRTLIPEESILELAKGIALHGMISPVTVRLMPSGRFELVAGERRIRAARIINMEMVPAVIKVLTDQQAREIRLLENLQRENAHPLDEAYGIAMLQEDGKSIDEISARLGKSKSYIYNRIKLCQLVPSIQEMFLANKILLMEAQEMAILSPNAQAEFFERHCTDWESESFTIGNFKYYISRYKYDLNEAPFDVNDMQLIPCAGACTTCPFNSATLSTLFPEMAEDATCTNKACYNEKCLAQSKNQILEAVENFHPTAILAYGKLSEEDQTVIDSLEQTAGLPVHSYYDVTEISIPEPPEKEDYTEEETDFFDEEGYNLALQEYHEDLAVYNERISAEGVGKALYFGRYGLKNVMFIPGRKVDENSSKKVTAKEVQEAIKQGNATPELLQGELSRIRQRENRAKEIDRDKVQARLHEAFSERLTESSRVDVCTVADLTAARLLVYQSLNYSSRSLVNDILFVDDHLTRIMDPKMMYQKLAELTETQYCFMIRLAISGGSESKLPLNINGIALYNMAGESGINVQGIEKSQAKIVKERLKKLSPRIRDLENRIKHLTDGAARKEAA